MASWLSSLVMCLSTRSRVMAGSSMTDGGNGSVGPGYAEGQTWEYYYVAAEVHGCQDMSSQSKVTDNAVPGKWRWRHSISPTIWTKIWYWVKLPPGCQSQPKVNDSIAAWLTKIQMECKTVGRQWHLDAMAVLTQLINECGQATVEHNNKATIMNLDASKQDQVHLGPVTRPWECLGKLPAWSMSWLINDALTSFPKMWTISQKKQDRIISDRQFNCSEIIGVAAMGIQNTIKVDYLLLFCCSFENLTSSDSVACKEWLWK